MTTPPEDTGDATLAVIPDEELAAIRDAVQRAVATAAIQLEADLSAMAVRRYHAGRAAGYALCAADKEMPDAT